MTSPALTCTRCNARPAVVLREQSGERACKSCFLKEIESRARSTMARERMLRPDDKLAIALSGGKDSVALVRIITSIHCGLLAQHARHGRPPVAITIDEGIAGYREESMAIARETCLATSIDHVVFSFKESLGMTLDEMLRAIMVGKVLDDIHEKRSPGMLKNAYKIVGKPCSLCGVLRRRVLNDVAARLGATVLATGHNMSDEVETFLINVVRGDVARVARVASTGSAAPAPFVRKIKPLQDIPQEDIVLHVFHAGGVFQTARCPHATGEAVFRGEIQAVMNRLVSRNPGTVHNVKKFMDTVYPLLASQAPSPIASICPSCAAPKSQAMDTCMTCFYVERICKKQYPAVLDAFIKGLPGQRGSGDGPR